VDVHVDGSVARTTIDQTFFNHTSMQLEGVYSFPLPPGASIARLAMYIDGKLVEGGVVERQKGRDAYESIVYQRRDPALLEWMNGNVFKIRIFPLPARSEKRIILSYTQTLEHLYDTYRLAVPIPELDAPVGHAKFQVEVAGGSDYEIASSTHDLAVTSRGADRVASFEKSHYTLPGDLLVSLRQKTPKATEAARFGEYLMVSARPELGTRKATHKPRRWALLYDTSASRQPSDLEAQAFFATHLLAECDDTDTYTIVAFDRTARVLPGPMHASRDDGSGARAFLAAESRGGIGDTDLEGAIAAALEKLGPASDETETILAYVGDGQATHGETRGAELAKRIGDRAKFVGVTLGDKTDTRLMQSLAVATGGLAVSATNGDDLAWRAFDLVATLNTPRILDLRATLVGSNGSPVGGAVAYAPAQLAAGESADVIARLPRGSDPVRLSLAGMLDGKPWSADFPIAPRSSDASYLPRLWAQRRIDAVMIAETDVEKQKAEVTRLGLENFLLTPFTSLLVLENDAMYKSFDVRRAATNDWARYAAPDEIKVVFEPVAQNNKAFDLGGTIVTRQPTAIFGRAQYYNDWDRGLRDTTTEATGDLFNARLRRKAPGPLSKNRISTLDALSRDDKSEEIRTWTGTFRQAGTGEATTLPMSKPVAAVGAASATDIPRMTFGHGSFGGGLAGKKGLLVDSKSISLGGEMEETLTGAFRWSYDERLDDLTELVPALFDDELDTASARMRATEALSDEHGSISADARPLLDKAFAAQKPGRFTTERGDVIITNGARYQHDRKLSSGLTEHVVYDGDGLVTTYPELDLVVTRSMGAAEPALWARDVPFVLPSLGAMERWYRVELIGARTLRLRPIAKELETIEIELDESFHVVRIGDVHIEHTPNAIIVRSGLAHTTLTRAAGSTDIDGPTSNAFVRVSMPLRDEAYWAERAGTPGTAEWRDAQRQLLATYAARSNGGMQANILRALWATGTLSRGELVLGSRGTRSLDVATLGKIGKAMADPIADYAVAARTFQQSNSAAALERVATAHPHTLAGMLAQYRALLFSVERGADESEQRARLAAFGRDYPDPMLRYVGAVQMTQRWSDSKAIAEVWDDLARDPSIAWHADAAAASVLRNRGWYELAAPRYQRAFFAAIDAGQLPSIDPSFRWVITQYAGEAGYRSFWMQWRTRVLGQDDPRALLSFVRALQYGGGEEDDLSAAFEAYERITQHGVREDDPDLRSTMVTHLTNSGRTADAWTILGRARSADADLYDLASRVAEHDGQLVDAARLIIRSMDALGNTPVDLATVRGEYARLLEVQRRIILSSHDSRDASWAMTSALDTAARWQADDPDNADIDRRCAQLLLDAHRPAEARRHLASITERHPAEGSAYAEVAGFLEAHGEDADDLWARAIEVEPTNPTWLLRRAQNILARGGSRAQAREMLDRIAKGKWQDRFSNIQMQAKRVLSSIPQ
jgi:hypothetical protein